MYFEIVSTPGGYRARIRSNNDEVIFVSEVYITKSVAEDAVEVVQTGIDTAPVMDWT